MNAIDFRNPEFIFQNLDSLSLSDEQIADDEELEGRLTACHEITAQVCFYTMCALRAYQGVIKAPRILIYGPGVVGTKIINTLIGYGLSSMLRIYVRNHMQLGKWLEKGIKASDAVSKLLKAGTFEIVICTANAASFSQFNRDLFGKISPKTCVISAVFGLQRARIYQLLKTPCVFRTFAERSDILKIKLDEPHETAPAGDIIRDVQGDVLPMSSLKAGAILMATRICDFKRQILLLENYYVLWGMTNEIAREQATNMILGGDTVADPFAEFHGLEQEDLEGSLEEREGNPSIDHASPPCSFSDVKSFEDDITAVTREESTATTVKKKKETKIPLLDVAVDNLAKRLGTVFQKEFSKIARIGDLVEFLEFRWDVINNKETAPRLLGDQLAAQTSFENRNRGIVYVSTFLTDIELKAIFRLDNEVPQNYYFKSDILEELDATDALTAIR